MTSLERPARSVAANRAWFGRFQNLSIRIKAAVASAVLLLCLLAVGGNAYLTSAHSTTGLRTLSQDLAAKQAEFTNVSDAVVALHMKIFRYVSWASNGVGDKLMTALREEIGRDLTTLTARLGDLAQRPDLSANETATLQQLLDKWEDCTGKAKDTIEVGRTDAAMATMMLGETDDSFKAVDSDLKRLAIAVTSDANRLSNDLYAGAQSNKLIIIIGTVAGFLVGVFIAVAVGTSIVGPVRSITDVMRRLSAGEVDVDIGYRDRRDEIGTMVEAISVFQRNIRQRQAELRVTFDNMDHGVAMFDGGLRLAAWNKNFQEIVGLPDEFFGASVSYADYIRYLAAGGELGADAEVALDRYSENVGRHYSFERTRPNGRVLDVRHNPLPEGGFVLIYSDITERKQREAKLAELVRELEVARDAAYEASRTKSAFLANMSHELRTPLNAIIGVTEMLEEDARDANREDELEPLERVLRAARHLLALINDILDLSKIEAGRMELYLERFSLRDLVEDVAKTIETMATRNGNRIVIDHDAALGSVYGDQIRVRQALMNLASNASKFTENGTITIATGRIPKAERFQIKVTDTGIGIGPDQIGRLFQEFTQADSSTTRKYGGTGLGLAISRRFCQMMDGDISVESELGVGSTFTIVLPVQAAEAAATPGEADAGQVPFRTTPEQGGVVLVVDDDATVREIVGRYLDREGFEFVTASGGQEGLRLARELDPIAITLDVAMPDLDGWTVLAALKGDPQHSDIPVILLTIIDEKQRGFALGAAEYLVKPVDRDQLIRTLRQISGATGGQVLVVDDDQMGRHGIKLALEHVGWRVVEAENGRVALDRLADISPDAILLDLMMPEMDGFEFLEQVRLHEAWRDIPVIVVTARDLTVEERMRLNGSIERIIQKTERDDLLREVRSVLTRCVEQRRRRRAAVA